MKLKLWEAEFKPIWPVGGCLVVLAETEGEAILLAGKTLGEDHLVPHGVKELPMEKGVVVYLNGDY